jgi:hypothetical protein
VTKESEVGGAVVNRIAVQLRPASAVLSLDGHKTDWGLTIAEPKLTASLAHQVTPRRYRELSHFQQSTTDLLAPSVASRGTPWLGCSRWNAG